jgi:hypothetical protein
MCKPETTFSAYLCEAQAIQPAGTNANNDCTT